ncbi:MAG TPA: MTH938/NDUFAF3 family protein [Thermohalobaculum sp.]|nr:MTH938/NDUFAF3 family protein [Thermohalobaculum sp.]
MRMVEINLEGRRPVDAYGPGGFRIDGVWHTGSVILTPGGLHGFEGPVDLESLGPVIAQAGGLDVVLIGQGAEIAALARPLRVALEEAGIGVEIMSTASACRTYNVLLAEDRRVAAVLVAV